MELIACSIVNLDMSRVDAEIVRVNDLKFEVELDNDRVEQGECKKK